MNANTVPLQETLPWSPEILRNFLICDSIESEGDFVVRTMVSQIFATPSLRKRARVLWLAGHSSTERQMATALKRMGCDMGASYTVDDRQVTNPLKQERNLTIRNLTAEVAQKLATFGDDEDNDEVDFDSENYLRQVYKQTKAWILENSSSVTRDITGVIISNEISSTNESNGATLWIILDDISSMATILGEKNVFCFVTSLLALSSHLCTTPKFGTIIRCSKDLDQISYKMRANEDKDQSGWLGAGGLAHKVALKERIIYQNLIPWERILEEYVDGVVDVLSLPSGFSREAHGRLIFSETPNGRGWGGGAITQSTSQLQSKKVVLTRTSITSGTNSWNKLIINYCVQDTGVRAIRLRTASTST